MLFGRSRFGSWEPCMCVAGLREGTQTHLAPANPNPVVPTPSPTLAQLVGTGAGARGAAPAMQPRGLLSGCPGQQPGQHQGQSCGLGVTSLPVGTGATTGGGALARQPRGLHRGGPGQQPSQHQGHCGQVKRAVQEVGARLLGSSSRKLHGICTWHT